MPKRKRNPNGAGSIYLRKDGRYEAAAYVTTTTGERKRVRVYGKTWDEAHEELVKLLNNERQGVPVPTSSESLGAYLDYWLEQVVKPEVRPATYRSYELSVRLYIRPGLGSKKLDKLSTRDIRTWLNKVRETCLCCAHGKDKARPESKQRCCAKGQCCRRYPSARTVQVPSRDPAQRTATRGA